MDHVIEYILDYMKMDVDAFKAEYEECNTMMQCPSYRTIQAYCKAIAALNDIDGRYSAYVKPEYLLKNYSR